MQERLGDNYRSGVEADAVTDAECKNDVQPIGLHIVLVTLVDKLGECLTVGVVFCLIRHSRCFVLQADDGQLLPLASPGGLLQLELGLADLIAVSIEGDVVDA